MTEKNDDSHGSLQLIRVLRDLCASRRRCADKNVLPEPRRFIPSFPGALGLHQSTPSDFDGM
jgi:hypothetical protein